MEEEQGLTIIEQKCMMTDNEVKEMISAQMKQKRNSTNEFMHTSLSKGNYNIHYVINLLKILITQANAHQLRRQDFPFSVKISAEKLLISLEMERDSM